MVIERLFLQRLSAFTAHHVRSLHDGAAMAALAACERSAERSAESCDQAAQALFALVSETTDAELRRRRVNLRRAVRANRYHGYRACLEPTDAAFGAVMQAEQCSARYLASLEAFRAAHDAELAMGRRRLAELASDVRFLAGIEISSSALTESITRRGLWGQKDVHMDERLTRGVLRYFLRATMKATPFGSFCMILPSEWQDASHASNGTQAKIDEPWSALSLNRSLHGEVIDAIVVQDELRERLPVMVNPGAMRTAEGWLTIASRGGMESVVHIRNTPLVDAVVGILSGSGPVPPATLTNRLVQHFQFEESESYAVRSAVGQLIDAGLLHRRIAIGETDANWPELLADALAGLRDPAIERVADDIRYLVAMLSNASHDRTGDGRSVSAPAREIVRRIGDSLNASLSITTATPVHEEYFASRHVAKVSREGWDSALQVLRRYVRHLLPLSSPRIEQMGMRRFFDSTLPDRQSISLYEFYELISAELLKSAPEPGALSAGRTLFTDALLGNPFGLDGVKAIRKARDLIAQRLALHCAGASKVVNISLEELFAHSGDLLPTPSGPISTSVFATPVIAADGQRMLVVNQGSFGLGFGKYFSRFASFASTKWRNGIVQRNSVLGLAEEVCELVGTADFGANVHECLFLRRVHYPTDAAPGSKDDITLSQLDVARHPNDQHRLVLVERETGRLITLVDGGFLSIRLRPALHQLLACFVPVRGGMCKLPEHGPTGSLPITHRPRIVVDGSLVLCRESWQMNHTVLPKRRKGELAADFFRRAREFWKAESLPSRCFMRLNQVPAQNILPNELDDEAAERGRRDDPPAKMVVKEWNKPMYFDLDSPLLVAQLGAVCHGMTFGSVTVEEALPDLLGEHDGVNGAHATEWTLEIDGCDGDVE
jgi:hypothetical protein